MADAAVEVTFTNCRGERLRGLLHGAVGPLAVVTCHGMFSNKDGPNHQRLADALANELPVLRFDFAGSGASEGSLFNLSYSRRMEDLDAAIEFLVGLGVVRVALFGSSMGGAVAYLAAARDERIVRIATLAAVAHPAELVRRQMPEAIAHFAEHAAYDSPWGRIGREFWLDSQAHDVVAAVRILRAPILVVHGDQDDTVPCSDAHDIATAARHASLDLVEGADHAFTSPQHLRPAMRRIATFLAHP